MLDLLDFGDYPHIEAAGVADAYLIGPNRARFVCFDWFKINGVMRRKVTGDVCRSLSGLREEQHLFWSGIFKHASQFDCASLH